MEPASVAYLPDGKRAHLHHGPIDLVIDATGAAHAVREAYAAASRRFGSILEELCDELSLLRMPAHTLAALPSGRVARRMVAAVMPYAARTFITPMAAVAGAVAEEVLEAMTASADLRRAYVNNGGDIALHLVDGASFDIGIVDRPEMPWLAGTARIDGGSRVRGIATSGWRGRSFSFGIADSVTILAASASDADAAATIVANAVDLPGHPAVKRARAASLQPDNDLGDKLVTIGVGSLNADEVEAALDAGRRAAEQLISEGRIVSAALFLNGRGECAGRLDLTAPRIPPDHFGSTRLMSRHG